MSEIIYKNTGAAKIIPEESSRRITALRFILIVFVVFLHNNLTQEQILEDALKNDFAPFAYSNNLAGRWIQIFICGGIAKCAVPLFFMFAAYLQFMKNDSYKVLLKKKVKSLALPFFLWPVLNLVVYTGLKILAQAIFPGMIERPNVFVFSGWNAADWLHAFFGYEDMTEGRTFGGYVYQFWFVRDLFIMISLSPALRLFVRKFPFCAFFTVSFFYFSDTRPFFAAAQALFYYTLGIFWAENDFDMFTFCDKIKWRVLAPVYLALWLSVNKFYGEFSCAYWFMVLLSCVVMMKFSFFITKSEKAFCAAKYLAGFSFFLYAAHTPFLEGSLQGVWRKLFPMTDTFRCMAEFFGVSILTCALGTFSGAALKKICPPLFRILNGGR